MDESLKREKYSIPAIFFGSGRRPCEIQKGQPPK
jgi:hypothetical protein